MIPFTDLQDLVRRYKFDFAACACYLNDKEKKRLENEDACHVFTSDEIRIAYATKHTLPKVTLPSLLRTKKESNVLGSTYTQTIDSEKNVISKQKDQSIQHTKNNSNLTLSQDEISHNRSCDPTVQKSDHGFRRKLAFEKASAAIGKIIGSRDDVYPFVDQYENFLSAKHTQKVQERLLKEKYAFDSFLIEEQKKQLKNRFKRDSVDAQGINPLSDLDTYLEDTLTNNSFNEESFVSYEPPAGNNNMANDDIEMQPLPQDTPSSSLTPTTPTTPTTQYLSSETSNHVNLQEAFTDQVSTATFMDDETATVIDLVLDQLEDEEQNDCMKMEVDDDIMHSNCLAHKSNKDTIHWIMQHLNDNSADQNSKNQMETDDIKQNVFVPSSTHKRPMKETENKEISLSCERIKSPPSDLKRQKVGLSNSIQKINIDSLKDEKQSAKTFNPDENEMRKGMFYAMD